MTDMSKSARPEPLPRPIVRVLSQLIARTRMVIALRGICLVVATTLTAILAVMLIDRLFTFLCAWPRWTLFLCIVTAGGIATGWALIRPLAHTFSLSGIARVLESRHPELHERISSSVELLASRERQEVLGSKELIQALAVEASADVQGLKPSREITFRTARPFLLAAGGVVLILGGLVAVWPHQSTRLLARAVAPFLNLPNVAADQLSVTPGDTVALPDQSVRIEVHVANEKAKKAFVHLVKGAGARRRREMTRLSDEPDGIRRFSFSCPPSRQDWRYRIHSGGALTRYYSVRIIPPPAVRRLDIRYEYPPYVNLPPKEEEDAEGKIEAVQGTRVSLSALVSKPVETGALLLKGRDAPLAQAGLSALAENRMKAAFQFELEPGLDGQWMLRLKDEYGFTNREVFRPIAALPDKPPGVRVVSPQKEIIRLRPTDRLPVAYAAVDDYGLAEVGLLLKEDDAERHSEPLSLESEGGRPPLSATGATELDFSKRRFEGVRRVQFQVYARDRLPETSGGPQEARSRTFTVLIQRNAPPYALQRWTELEEHARKDFERLLDQLKAAQKDSSRLRSELSESPRPAEKTEKQARDLAGELNEADASARDLAQRLRGGPFESLTPPLNSVADDHIRKAANATEEITRAAQAPERAELAQQAESHTQSAVADVSELLDRLNKMAGTGQLLQELSDLTERQKELAAASEQLQDNPQQSPMSERNWRAAQQDAASQLARMLKETTDGAQAQAAQGQQQFSELARQARQLSQQEMNLAQDTQAGQDRIYQSLRDRLAQEQAQLARETDALVRNAVIENGPQEDNLDQSAAQAVHQAAQQMESGRLTAAAQSAADASNRMNRFSQRLQDKARQTAREALAQEAPSPQAARLTADHMALQRALAEDSAALADRQGELGRQIRALASAQTQEVLASRNQQLMARTQELRRATQAAQQAMSATSPQPGANASANQARQELRNAARAQQLASNALQAGQRSEAGGQHQQAAANLQAASEALQQAGQAYAAAASEQAASQSQAEGPRRGQSLSRAYSASQQAARSARPLDAAQAAQRTAAARSQVAAEAQQMGVSSFSPAQQALQQAGYQRMTRDSRSGKASFEPDDTVARLKRAGIKLEDWAKLPGRLRDDILQAPEQKSPEQYRKLIRDYFRTIARRGGAAAYTTQD